MRTNAFLFITTIPNRMRLMEAVSTQLIRQADRIALDSHKKEGRWISWFDLRWKILPRSILIVDIILLKLLWNTGL